MELPEELPLTTQELAKLFKAAGYTNYRQIGKALGVTKATVCKWLRGKRKLSAKAKEAIRSIPVLPGAESTWNDYLAEVPATIAHYKATLPPLAAPEADAPRADPKALAETLSGILAPVLKVDVGGLAELLAKKLDANGIAPTVAGQLLPDLRKVVEELAQKFAATVNGQEDAVEKALDACVKRLAPLLKQDEAKAGELGNKADQLQVKADAVGGAAQRIEAKADELGNEVEEIGAKADELGNKVKEIGAKADQLQAKANEVGGAAQRLEVKADELGNEVQQFQAKANEVEGAAQRLEAKADELGNEVQQLQAKANEVEGAAQRLEAKTDQLQAKANEVGSAAQRIEVKANELGNEAQQRQAQEDAHHRESRIQFLAVIGAMAAGFVAVIATIVACTHAGGPVPRDGLTGGGGVAEEAPEELPTGPTGTVFLGADAGMGKTQGRRVPSHPLKGQARAPCPDGTVESNGSCWLGGLDKQGRQLHAPCPIGGYESPDGLCLFPASVDGKPLPNSEP